MTAKRLDLTIEQGATFKLNFTWADSVKDPTTGAITQVPKNLTGCTGRMQIRAGYGKTVMVLATTENNRLTLGANGAVQVVLDAVYTDRAPLYKTDTGRERVRKRAVYDLEVQFPDGRVDRVLEGRVTFVPNITRDGASTGGGGGTVRADTYYDRYYDKY